MYFLSANLLVTLRKYLVYILDYWGFWFLFFVAQFYNYIGPHFLSL